MVERFQTELPSDLHRLLISYEIKKRSIGPTHLEIIKTNILHFLKTASGLFQKLTITKKKEKKKKVRRLLFERLQKWT